LTLIDKSTIKKAWLDQATYHRCLPMT